MDNREAFAKRMAAMCAAFRTECTDPLLEAYWMALEDLSEPVFNAAVKRAIATEKFMPPPATLLELAGAKAQTSTDRALTAWGFVVEAIRKHGSYSSVEFVDDQAIHGAIRRLGGWLRLCSTDSEELHSFRRKEFIEAYESCEQHPDPNPQPLRGLPGMGDKVARIVTREPKSGPKALPPVPRNGKPGPSSIGDLVATLMPKDHQ